MFLILKIIYDAFKKYDDEYRDRRSENYPIAGSPLQMILLPIAYYVFVKHLGPKLMEKRKPFELKYVILLYNFIQVIANSYIVIRACYSMFWELRHIPVSCVMPALDYSPRGRVELHLSYMYFSLKIFDYLDTVFMVLRKRNKQISFLHVYHHIMVSVGTFIGMRYLPGGHATAFGVGNSFVHSIMYSYYFLTALRPELKNSLWWKKHITHIQLIQFLALFIHFCRPLVEKNCDFPVYAALIGITQSVVMLILFGDFYRRTYLKRPLKNK